MKPNKINVPLHPSSFGYSIGKKPKIKEKKGKPYT
jgi:hypothetical protein